MATYNSSSAVNANTTAYAQRVGNPSFGAPTYAVPNVPTTAQLQRKPFSPAYRPTKNTMPVNDTTFKITPDDGSDNTGFNPGTAYQFIQASGNSLKMGDGGVHDQTVDQAVQKLNGDVQRLGSSENPDAVKQEIENDPWYADNSLWKGIFNAAAATYSGKSVDEAYQAGMKGIQQGEAENTRDMAKQNAIKNRAQLLQNYTADSVAQYELTGDQSQLREKKLTQAEQDARAAAATQDQRAYEQSIYERNRKDQKADAAEAAANKPKSFKYAKGIGLYDEATGLDPNGNPIDTNKANGDLGGTVPKGSLSIGDYNNAVITSGKDPYTGEPVKSPQLKQAQDWDKGRTAYQSTMTGADEALSAVDYMLDPKHDTDFRSAFGSVDSRLPTTRSGTANMEAQLTTLKSQAFLSSIKEMKGMGSLSDAEGAKLVAAIATLDPSMPQKALQAQLAKVKDHLSRLKQVSTQEAQRKGYIEAPTNGALSQGGNTPAATTGADVASSMGF